jgi:OFA family oxalate/formate antiporter-like MFS transporter
MSMLSVQTTSVLPDGIKRLTDKDILGYSRWVVFAAAFLGMAVLSPYEYAWSSMADRIGGTYEWSPTQIGWMFTLFVVFESIGTLPGGVLCDKFGPRRVTLVSGVIAGVGILSTSFGPSYAFVLVLWCIGSFFAGFIYNACMMTANRWFPDKRGLTAGMIAAAFSWGSLPFIIPIRAIPKTAPDATFFRVIYVMAAIIGSVCIVAALFMRNPPVGWRPEGWVPRPSIKRPSEHQFTMGQALSSWQMWLLIISFILISSAGLAGVSKIMTFAKSFGFSVTAATVAAGGIAVANGLGRVVLGALADRIGCENAMIRSYILTGVFLLLTLVAGSLQNEVMFVAAAILAIFFWGPLFSLFPTIIGQYYGGLAAGSNYGMLYAVAKGSGGVYGGVLSAVLIFNYGYPVTMGAAALMAICAGLLIMPLKKHPPMWKGVEGAGGRRS